jgi:hypothetical protein
MPPPPPLLLLLLLPNICYLCGLQVRIILNKSDQAGTACMPCLCQTPNADAAAAAVKFRLCVVSRCA